MLNRALQQPKGLIIIGLHGHATRSANGQCAMVLILKQPMRFTANHCSGGGHAPQMGLPDVTVLMATAEDDFRKPKTGMWTFFVEHLNGGVAPGTAFRP